MSTIINPETGRKIKVGGKVHMDLLARSVLPTRRSSRVQSRSRSKSRGKILNPATGRMVDRQGLIGQRVLSGEQKQAARSRPSRRMQELAREADMYGLDGKVFLEEGTRRTSNRKIKAAVKRSGSKKYQGRPSPSHSATLYDVGFKMVGNDDNMWVIRADKNGRHSWKRV